METRENQKNKIIGISGLFTAVVLGVLFWDITAYILDFSAEYLSPDGSLSEWATFLIKIIFAIFILLLAGISIILFFNLWELIISWINRYVAWEEAVAFFTTDEICTNDRLAVWNFWIGTSAGVLLHFLRLTLGEPSQEGIVEMASTVLFLIAGIIFLLAGWRMRNLNHPPATRRKAALLASGLGVLILLAFGEEISWGQHFFGWESFGVFEEVNFQQETNVHNFFNPLTFFLYPVLGMGAFVVFLFGWFFPRDRKNYFFQLFFPHPSFLLLLFIMACSTFYGHSEIYEELMGLLLVLYGVRMLACLRQA